MLTEKYTCALNPAACVFLLFFFFFCLSFSPRIILKSLAAALDIKSLAVVTSIVPLLLLDSAAMKDKDIMSTLPDAAGLSQIMKL